MKILKAINAWCSESVNTSRINHYVNETVVWTLIILVISDIVLHFISTL
jgi:hypothetical protein